MSRLPDPVHCSSPFSPAYWRHALADMRDPRLLTFSALMIAVCWGLGMIPSIQLPGAVKISWGFLARSLCSMVVGPFNALIFGAAEDTITYLLHPTGPYFPGYMFTTMQGNLIYALFLYRADYTRPTFALRIFLAKLLTNVQNVFLGSLWSYILYGKQTYWGYMSVSAVKNTAMLLPQTIMLVLLFTAMLPILRRSRLMDW